MILTKKDRTRPIIFRSVTIKVLRKKLNKDYFIKYLII